MCSFHWKNAAEKQGPILFTCSSSLWFEKVIPSMPQCKFRFWYPKTKQWGVFEGRRWQLHGSHPSSVLPSSPVLRSLVPPHAVALDLGFLPWFNQTHEMEKSKAVGKLSLYGSISPEISFVGYSFSDGEREGACEVTQSSETGIQWERRSDFDFQPQNSLAAGWQTLQMYSTIYCIWKIIY